MFHDIPGPILKRMSYLEGIDAQDRKSSTPVQQRLRQVPPETGRLLAILAAGAPRGELLEIGTSAGYSGLWLALACRDRGDRLITFELLPEKVRLAQETFRTAGVEPFVQLIQGDALQFLPGYQNVAFCFLDTEKDLYRPCHDIVVPNLVRGGLLVADNLISHAEMLAPFLKHARIDPRLDTVLLPVGQGVLLCRKT
jgi:predicted O-methyltransferase YrrM